MKIVTNTENSESPILERNYVLSLVYEMGKQTSENTSQKGELLELDSLGFFVGGETDKYISVNEEAVQNTCNDLDITIMKSEEFKVIPDLVIHNSHNPEAGQTGCGQHLALEAKTTKKLGKFAFMKDFFKLNVYLSTLRFEKVIYLIVNSRAEQINTLIKQYLKNGYYQNEHSDQLLFFIQENKDVEPVVYRFLNHEKPM